MFLLGHHKNALQLTSNISNGFVSVSSFHKTSCLYLASVTRDSS